MKKSIRVLSIILALTMIMSMITITSFADETAFELTWNTTTIDGEECAVITGYTGTLPNGELIIPRKVNDGHKSYFVREIANGSGKSIFGDTTLITSIKLPETLKKIGDYAFQKTSITEITIPKNVTYIGTRAFQGCSGLKTLTILSDKANIAGKNDSKTFAGANLDGVIVFPSGTSYVVEGKVFENSTAGDGKGHLIFGENVKCFSSGDDIKSTGASFVWNSVGLESLVMSNSIKRVHLNSFDGKLKNIKKVFVLGDANFEGGSVKEACTWYVASEDVKNRLINDGKVVSDNIKVINNYLAVFADTDRAGKVQEDIDFGLPYSVLEVPKDNNVIELLAPDTKDGFEFVGWTDGKDVYEAGSLYTVESNVVLHGLWSQLTEKDTVLYRNIEDENGGAVTFDKGAIGRIVCENAGNDEVDITLTDEFGFTETVEKARFIDGTWINHGNDSEYVSVQMPDAYGKYTAYVELKNGAVINLDPEETAFVTPRINGDMDSANFKWSNSDSTVAELMKDINEKETGELEGSGSGTTTITIKSDDESIKLEFSVKVETEIDAILEKESNEAEFKQAAKEYFDRITSVVNRINVAIEAEDKDTLVKIFSCTESSAIKLNDFNDIRTKAYEKADAVTLGEFAERVINCGEIIIDGDVEDKSVGEIKEQLDAVKNMNKSFAREFAVGKINGLSDITEIEKVIVANNGIYVLPIENKYYKENTEDALEYLVDYKAVNYEGFLKDFKDAYTLAAFFNAPNYESLAAVIVGCAEEIGYNKEYYDEIKGTQFHKDFIESSDDFDKESLETIKVVASYIDNYTASEEDDDKPSRPSYSGGRGEVKKDPITTFIPEEESHSQKVLEDKTPLFADVENDRWSNEAIAYLVANSIVNGYSDGTFLPENKITRAEFVKMIAVAFGLTAEEEESVENVVEETEEESEIVEEEFKLADVTKNDWYYPYVKGAVEANAVNGDDAGNFNPNAQITRQEAAAIIYRITAIKPVASNKELIVNITDDYAIADWAYTSVQKLLKMGILSGYEDGSFKPAFNISREEASKLIYNMIMATEVINNEK